MFDNFQDMKPEIVTHLGCTAEIYKFQNQNQYDVIWFKTTLSNLNLYNSVFHRFTRLKFYTEVVGDHFIFNKALISI